MNPIARHLGRWEMAVLILCGAFVLLTLGAAGESGRGRAKQIVCQSNLRQWHQVFQGYIDHNDGKFFHGVGVSGWGWIYELSSEHKDWKHTKIWFCPKARRPLIDENGNAVQGSNVFNAWGIYKDSDAGPNGLAGSYGLNGYLVHIPEEFPFEGGVPWNDGWRDLRAVPNAQRVPMFLDALRYDMWPRETEPPAPDEFSPWTKNQMARCCINRHVGAVKCLFVDGSVRKVGLKELWTLKWHRSFDTAGPWTKAGGVMPADWPRWMSPFKEY